jgi:hypothetical protein
MQYIDRAGSLMQIIKVLRDDRDFSACGCQLADCMMGSVWLGVCNLLSSP